MSESIQTHKEYQKNSNTQLVKTEADGVYEYHDKYLTFELKGMIYGIDILDIKEIIEYDQVTKIPMTPSYIRGVLNLRGNVVPIVDLSVRLGKGSLEAGKKTCIIILGVQQDGDEIDLGVVVDSVTQVIDIENESIEATPSFGMEIRTDFVAGMGKVNDKFVTLLDMDKVLLIKELAEFYNTFHDDDI